MSHFTTDQLHAYNAALAALTKGDSVIIKWWHAEDENEQKYLHTITYTDNRGYEHRLDGPVTETWHPNGKLKCRIYRKGGMLHRDPREGPAHEMWSEFWYEGERHPTDHTLAYFWEGEAVDPTFSPPPPLPDPDGLGRIFI